MAWRNRSHDRDPDHPENEESFRAARYAEPLVRRPGERSEQEEAARRRYQEDQRARRQPPGGEPEFGARERPGTDGPRTHPQAGGEGYPYPPDVPWQRGYGSYEPEGEEERYPGRRAGRGPAPQGYEMGHHYARSQQQAERSREADYPPGFNWGPRSGYPEEQASGAPFDLSNRNDPYVQWRERQLEEYDRQYERWRAEQARKLDEDYKAWSDSQQEKFSNNFEAWRKQRTPTENNPAPSPGPAPKGNQPGPGHSSSPDAQKKKW